MVVSLLIKGCGIGLSMAMPVGPIGLLCIRYSLAKGAKYGFAAGIGAAFADAFYGAVAGLGITAITMLLKEHGFWLSFLGSAFLWYLAFSTYFSQPKENEHALEAQSRLGSIILSTFFLTIVNPLTIVSFTGLYTGIGAGFECSIFEVLFITFGVFVGSLFWWLILSSGVAKLGEKYALSKSNLLNRISGVILAGFAFISSLNLL